MKQKGLLSLLIALTLNAGIAYGGSTINQELSFQGLLKNVSGVIIPDGTYRIKFVLKRSNSGTPIWSKTMDSTSVLNGLFSVVLGGNDDSAIPLTSTLLDLPDSPTGLFHTVDVLLDIDNDGIFDDTFAGLPLTSVPSAFNADRANLALSVAAGSITSTSLANNSVTAAKIPDASITLSKIGQNGASTGQVMIWDGSSWAPSSTPGGAVTSVDGTAPISISGGATTPTISVSNATTSAPGVVQVGTGLNVSAGSISLNFGTTVGTAAQGNDSRFSDSRTPTGVAGGDLTGTFPNPTLLASGVTPGSYPRVTVDSKGRVTAGSGLSSSDLPIASSSTPGAIIATSGKLNVDLSGAITSLIADSAAVASSANGLRGIGIASASPNSGQVLKFDGSAWTPTDETAFSAITSLNGSTTATQTFAVNGSGTDFGISTAGGTHTFSLPDASITNRGVITTGNQTFGGNKTFTGSLAVTGADLMVTAADSGKGIIIKAANANPDSLQEWQNSGGSILAKVDSDGNATFASVSLFDTTPSMVPVLDGSSKLISSSVTASELSYLSGLTSNIQSQIGVKQGTGNYLTGLTGDITASGPGNVSVSVSSVGGVSASTIATGTGLAIGATNGNTGSTLIKRDSSGNFAAGTITADLAGNATTANSALSFSGFLSGDVSGTQSSTSVASVGGVSATNIAAGATLANAGTSSNAVGALIRRDVSGNFSAGTITATLTGNISGSASNNVLKSGDVMTGLLYLSGDPTSDLGATTKQYVDNLLGTGVASFNSRNGIVVLSYDDVTGALNFDPVSKDGDTFNGYITLSANPTAALHAATKNYVDLGLATKQGTGSYVTGLTGDVSASGPGNVVGTVNTVGGVSAANVASGVTAVNAATSDNTASSLVKRDASGNFSAGTITANLLGNATTATSFSGALSGDITGTQTSTTVSTVGGVSASNIALGANTANAGTSAAINSALVRRDSAGNFAAGTITSDLVGNVTGNVTGSASNNILKSGDLMNGFLTLHSDPTDLFHAATKNYVDFMTSISGVQTFNSRSGIVTLNLMDVTTALAFSPANTEGDTFTGFITLSADPTASLHAATKNYVDLGLATKQGTGNYLTTLTGDVIASGPGSSAASVALVGGVTASNVASGANMANAGTSANTASTLVKRDVSGNFSAGTITAALAGNATTATTATNFTGTLSGDITGTQASTTVSTVGGVTASNVASGANTANAGTTTNTASTLVKRDASGNFAAGTVTAALTGNVTGNLTGNVTGSASSNILRSGDAMTGFLSLISDPTDILHAATKNYVDFKSATSGVQSFNSRTGAVTLSLSDVTSALTFGPANKTGDTFTGFITLSADPTASLHAATKNYVDLGLATKQGTGDYVTGLTGDVSASGPGNVAGTVNTVGGVAAANIASGANTANAATASNTASTLVKRDISGNFSAGTITAALSGNATTATTATNFSGTLSGDITGTQASTTVSSVGGVTATNVASGANTANAGTNTNTASTLVKRDASGNFAAGTVTAALTGNVTGNLTGNVTGSASSNILRSGDAMTGFLSLISDPTDILHAATKNYVDFKSATSGVQSFNSRTGTVTLSLSDVTSALTFGPANKAGDTFTGFITLSADPTAALHGATKNYVDLGLATKQGTGDYVTGLTGDVSASGPGNVAGTVNTVGGVTAANIASGANTANAGTSANTASTLVKRDINGNFSAATITAALAGNATTATNATNFTGTLSGDITGTQASTTVSTVGGVTATNIASGANTANAGTTTNTVSTLVKRDASGNFAAGTVTAALTGNVTGNLTGNVTGNVTGSASSNILRAGDAMTGFLSLSADPTDILHAATKNYVDFKTSNSGVQSFNSRTGTVTLSLSDVTSALTFGPANKAGDTFTGFITLSADPTASLHAATKNYVDIGLATKQGTGDYVTGLTGDVSASGPGNVAGTVNTVGGVTAANIASGANTANAGTSANTASTLVKRDISGNFSAGTITAALAGNATTATTATNFSGTLSGDITGTQASTTVSTVGGVTATNVASGANTANAGTTTNTASTLVKRDASGNFAAGTVTAALTGNVTGNLTGNVTGSASSNILRSGDAMTGFLSLISDPTDILHAATKNYVDFKSSTSGVQSFNSRTGTVTLSLSDVTSALTFGPANKAGDTFTGFITLSADPTASLHAATKNYVDIGLATKQGTGDYVTGLTGDVSASGPGNVAGTVNTVGGVTAANIASGANTANAGTSANTASTLVKRDISGNFSAGTITAALSGNATTATTATHFSGTLSGDITGTQASTTVSTVGGVTAANVASGANTANAGTTTNTASTLVKRDASGNFAAGTVTAALTGNVTGNLTGNVTGSASSNILRSGDAMTGFLSLISDPTDTLHAATKNYVDFKSATSGVQSFNSRTGTVTLSLSDVTSALTFGPANKAGDTFTGFITLSANPTATLHAATKNYVDLGLATKQGTGSYMTALTGDVTAAGPGSSAAAVALVGGVSAANIALGANAANAATNTNTVSTLIKRDASGNFSAGTITATLAGTATGFSGSLSGDITGTQASTTVSTVGGVTAANVALGANAANAGTTTNTVSTLVKRDASGNFAAGTITAALTGNVTGSASSNLLRAGDAMTGFLTLSADPTATLHSATKNYVDNKFGTGVTSFNTRTGAVVLSLTDITTTLTFGPANKAGDTFTGFITLSAAPTATLHAATKNYVDLGLATKQGTGNYVTGLTGDISASGPGNVAGTVNTVGGVTAANVATGANAANAATNTNTASTLIKRDASGNFAAGTVTATLAGSASNFSGILSGDITGTQVATTVSTVGGVTAANVALGANAANAGTTTNTVSTLVKRDASGNFAAGTVTAALTGNVTGNLTGNVTGSASSNILRTGDVMTGFLSLNADPTGLLQAATKNYVDFKTSTPAGVTAFNTRTGSITLSLTDVTSALTFGPANKAGDTFTGFITLSADPTAALHASTKNYVDLGLATKQGTGSYMTALTGDVTAAGPGSSAAAVALVGGVSAANVALGANAANAATNTNTVSTLIKRDASGNFSAGTITATLVGTASNFSGTLSGDITGTQATTTVSTVGGVTAANVASGANAANAGTTTNTVSTLVKRDASGNFAAGTITAALTGNVIGSASSNILRTGDAMTGFLSLNADPTSLLQAATKNYVDFKTSTPAGVTTFNTRTGSVTLSLTDVTTALTFGPVNKAGDTFTGFITLSADPTATLHAATKNYVDLGLGTKQGTGSYMTALTGDVTAAGPGSSAAAVALVGGVSAANVALGANAANAATHTNTVSTLIKRDASGNFSAGTITATLAGTATGFSGSLSGDITGTQASTTVSTVGGVTAANVASGANAANAGTTTNTVSTLVKRDASGNFAAGTITAALTGNVTGSASSNLLRVGDTMTGFLTLSADPTATLHSATKQYVDNKFGTGVTSFNTRTGAVVLSLTDVTGALGFDPANSAGDTFTGFITLNANPTANLHAATKNYVDLGLATKQATGNYMTALTGDVTAAGPGSSAATVATVGAVTAANVALGANAANAATSINTANTIVRRNATGNFTAGTITAALVGNATTATSFSGSLLGDITGTQTATTVSTVGAVTAANVALGANAANAATSINTANTIVRRNATGNFTAGTITAALVGNATTATTATSFSGSLLGDITGTQAATTVSTVGAVTAANVALGANAANAATSINTANTIVRRNATGNFTAGTITATLAGAATSFSGTLLGDITGTQAATTVSTVSGVTAANVAAGANLANAATNTSTVSTLIKRDASGNFAAATITAALIGNVAGTATGNVLEIGDTMTGFLTLSADPTANLHSATKQYVDTLFASGVTGFNSRTGAVTLTSADVTTALAFLPINEAGDTMSGVLTVNAGITIGNATSPAATLIQKVSSQTASISAWASVSGGKMRTKTFTFTGVAVGDAVICTPASGSPVLDASFIHNCYVSAADTITINMGNLTSTASTPATRTWRFTWIKQ